LLGLNKLQPNVAAYVFIFNVLEWFKKQKKNIFFSSALCGFKNRENQIYFYRHKKRFFLIFTKVSLYNIFRGYKKKSLILLFLLEE